MPHMDEMTPFFILILYVIYDARWTDSSRIADADAYFCSAEHTTATAQLLLLLMLLR